MDTEEEEFGVPRCDSRRWPETGCDQRDPIHVQTSHTHCDSSPNKRPWQTTDRYRPWYEQRARISLEAGTPSHTQNVYSALPNSVHSASCRERSFNHNYDPGYLMSGANFESLKVSSWTEYETGAGRERVKEWPRSLRH